jgi:transposase-like protein
MNKWVVMIIMTAVCIGALFALLAMEIECPYCHASDRNVNGMCVLQQKGFTCREGYHEQHFNKVNCPWCGSSGRMSRLDAFLD